MTTWVFREAIRPAAQRNAALSYDESHLGARSWALGREAQDDRHLSLDGHWRKNARAELADVEEQIDLRLLRVSPPLLPWEGKAETSRIVQ